MIKICKNGHMTGYKHCSYCGAKTEPQKPPFTETRATTLARIERVARQRDLWLGGPSNEQVRRLEQSERDQVAERRPSKNRVVAPRGTFSAVKNRMKNWIRGRRLAA